MAIKDETITMGKTEDGTEYVAETSAIFEETMADGSHVAAEITSTADPNDPTQIESHMTVTEIAADGTETITEVISSEDGTFIVEDESMFEELVEGALGMEISDNLTQIDPNTGQALNETASTEVYQAESDASEPAADFTIGQENFAPTDAAIDETYEIETSLDSSSVAHETVPPSWTDSSFGSTFEATADSPHETTDTNYGMTDTTDTYSPTISETPSNETSETVAAELAEQEAHVQAATDAQKSADEFIAAGDYAAAAQAREVAETEAWEAGDESMLSAYDAQDLTNAAEKQEEAAQYEHQQSEYAQAGDYEAAREASANAAYATSEADWVAGGEDHTGQADAEYQKMDMAVWEQDIADDKAQSAAAYAAEGNYETAEIYAASAADHQELADNFGDQGEHGGDFAVYDPSSEVSTGGAYVTTYDASISTVDTSYDTSMDMSMDTGYDSGSEV